MNKICELNLSNEVIIAETWNGQKRHNGKQFLAKYE